MHVDSFSVTLNFSYSTLEHLNRLNIPNTTIGIINDKIILRLSKGCNAEIRTANRIIYLKSTELVNISSNFAGTGYNVYPAKTEPINNRRTFNQSFCRSLFNVVTDILVATVNDLMGTSNVCCIVFKVLFTGFDVIIIIIILYKLYLK